MLRTMWALVAVLVVGVMVGGGAAREPYDPNQDYTQCCQCSNLMPLNVVPGTVPQVMPSPFKIVVKAREYTKEKQVEVELVSEGNHKFRDFILIAWATDERPKVAEGAFKLLGDNKEFLIKYDCYTNERRSFAVLAGDRKQKKSLRFGWQTKSYAGHIQFRATFIVDDYTYWVAEKSALLLDPRSDGPGIPESEKPFILPPINTDACGISKGCYREPEGCWEPNCEYIVTWQANQDIIRFELGGLGDGAFDRYVAVALSNDTYMGEDIVFACAHNSLNKPPSTGVYMSHNVGKENIALDRTNRDRLKTVLSENQGSYHNGRLRCFFTVHRDMRYYFAELPHITGSSYHLLMSRGFASDGNLRRHGLGVNELPIASPVKVDMLDRKVSIGDRARYPLVKAHGCLMILAWVFFASLGLLMTKYYKTMWPNKRMFDQRYWFVTHFNCMAMVFLVTVIAIIIIFVEADGWSKAPDLPQRAHPILGIIIFVCIIINPILALIRPSENNKCRPVFNWFHWAFGTIANVLAIPQIFIGMDFGKANVPWWATWILVIWVIFHIVVELSLEVHQCCTYKKNKERRRKYEQQKRENPKLHIDEPEPAGRRFKRFMLFLHLTVTIIITLIMIIIIAVA
ncbi:putative ferric-chelate reductase 1 [Babylonia areolata]|uniref:putative ferric-chelate reductase 1 n=1 Tax=Babylonia areolata TaxID=304850 RepID=UPI003FD0586E